MQVLDIALKDLRQSFRSYFALAFMFGVPILVTGMFYFMFGGGGGEDEGFDLPRTSVSVVNLDRGSQDFSSDGLSAEFANRLAQAGINPAGGRSMGEVLLDFLRSDSLDEILEVSSVPDEANARKAVESGEVDVLLVIPENFSQAMTTPGERARLELYQDPTLTLGPGIVKSIVSQFIDGLAGTKIGVEVVLGQLTQAGVPIDDALVEEVLLTFIAASAQAGSEDSQVLVAREPVGEDQAQGNSGLAGILGPIMGGMMVLYAFFTGAASAQTILTETEKGTLPRLFTTPNPRATILTGKYLSVFLILSVQVTVLLLFSRYVFGIYWGQPLQVLLVALGLILLASTCGLFIVSFLKNTRQAGVVYGGVLTFSGMIGIIGVFTASSPAASEVTDVVSLIVPQGWAMRTVELAMGGSPIQDLLIFLGGVLIWSGVFFGVGILRLRRRFE
jgi:ABC-2 type transport system permease protein